MSNGCCTIVTPWFFAGSMPAFVSAAKSSYWLPPSQFATFLPFIFAIVVMPELFHVSCVIPERAKTCAMLTSVRALVTRREQARQPVDAELRLTRRDDGLRDDVRAAVLQRHVEALGLVEALERGRVVAGELRLRHPLELERDLRQLRRVRRGRCRARGGSRADGEHGERRPRPTISSCKCPFRSLAPWCPSVDSDLTAAGLRLTSHERPASSGRGRAPRAPPPP